VYVHNSRFNDNSAHISGDVHVQNGASVYMNRCVLSGAEAIAASLGGGAKYPGCSITADEGDGNSTANTTLCIFNSTINDAVSSAYATGSPQVSLISTNALIANTTIHGYSMGNIRADKRNAAVNIHIYNSLLLQTKTDAVGVNLSKVGSMNDYCSVMNDAKNGWTVDPLNQITVGDVDITWDKTAGTLQWSLKNGKTIGNYAKKDILAGKVKAAFPDFDAWLKIVDEDPYAIDYAGNQRNPDKMNPGSWDPKLQ
jgi:hypothetical protein